MAKYARVTMSNGESLSPVLVHDDGRGVRFYVNRPGRGTQLLASAMGVRIASWGETRRLERGGPRVKLPAAFTGDLPEEIVEYEALKGCQCSHPIKSFRPPFAWEEVPA
jgi:hypothetical protein